MAWHRCLHKCNSELFICLHEFRMNMSLQCWKQFYKLEYNLIFIEMEAKLVGRAFKLSFSNLIEI